MNRMISLLYLIPLLIFSSFAIADDAIDNGLTNSSATPYIIGGSDATNLQLKWQVKLIMPINDFQYKLCGGSIINQHWVLTAAHCLFNDDSSQLKDIFVRTINNRQHNVEKSYIHKTYQNKKYVNGYDIALLKIDGSFEPNQKILLADQTDKANAFIEFDNAFNSSGQEAENLLVSGYGLTNVEPKNSPDNLQSVLLSGLSTYSCSSYSNLKIVKSICALPPNTSEIKDSCMGDSGGPAVWQNKNNKNDTDFGLRLLGITSWGDATCSGFGAYTLTTDYIDWINLTISDDEGVPYNILDEKYERPTFEVDPFANNAGQNNGSNDISSLINDAGGSFGWLSLFFLIGLVLTRKDNKHKLV